MKEFSHHTKTAQVFSDIKLIEIVDELFLNFQQHGTSHIKFDVRGELEGKKFTVHFEADLIIDP